MPRRFWSSNGLLAVALLGTVPVFGPAVVAATGTSPAARVELAISRAESSLREGAYQAAEARYHEALHQGWLLLAMLDLQAGDATTAAVKLEAARAVAPEDLELAFALGRAYLGLARIDDAARVFHQFVEARPIPQTHVLIARTYREFRDYARCRAELRAALEQDPNLRYAHYEMGLTAVKQAGKAALDEAIAEFQAELTLSPDDPSASLELGVALVESQRHAEALPALELASRRLPPEARAFGYLGRALLGSGRPAEAVIALTRSLELAQQQGANAPALRAIQLQLGLALRDKGDMEAAAPHFSEAQRLSVQGTEAEREQLARYMTEPALPEAARAAAVPPIDISPVSDLSATERQELKRRLVTALCRSYLNLGILQAQQARFEPAAELFATAATLEPDFPQLQSSLGIAYFNARQYEKAAGALARARAANPDDAGLRRMLALSWLNVQAYAKAAELLQDDPQRKVDLSLQLAYGLALVKSDRASEAEQVFAELLARHGDSPEISVFLGQAHAQQGDFDAAIASLEHALALAPTVADANATLGVIYLKQGRLAEAEAALRAELAHNADDILSRLNLARALELQGRAAEALPLLRALLQTKPDFADAGYLLGKILLAQGQTQEALVQLEAAVRLAPEDANIHYQLAQAYQKTGQTSLAEQHLDSYRKLKEKKR